MEPALHLGSALGGFPGFLPPAYGLGGIGLVGASFESVTGGCRRHRRNLPRRDLRLNRDVAIKTLPAAFENDPNRMARFEREAHVLAALNHPNIAAIYGLEPGALVMELVEGETWGLRPSCG